MGFPVGLGSQEVGYLCDATSMHSGNPWGSVERARFLGCRLSQERPVVAVTQELF